MFVLKYRFSQNIIIYDIEKSIILLFLHNRRLLDVGIFQQYKGLLYNRNISTIVKIVKYRNTCIPQSVVY